MPINKKYFFILFYISLSCLLIINQTVLSQNAGQNGREKFCDERLKLDLRLGKVLEIVSYKRKIDAAEMKSFVRNNIKYKIISIVKFETADLYSGEKSSEAEKFFNVASNKTEAVKFVTGQTYLFEVNYVNLQPKKKESEKYAYIQPNGFIKTINEAQPDIEFLKSVRNSDKYEEILGTNEGEPIAAGIISGKFTQFAEPVFPTKLKKTNIGETVNVMVLIDESGNVIKAKSVCAKNPAFAEAAEKAATLSKFSPTLLDGKAVKVKGVITYNFHQ